MATRVPFPPDDPTVYQVKIAGILVDPKLVLVEVRGLKTGINLDVKEGPGINGAALTFQGRKLGRFTIELKSGHQSPMNPAEEGYAIAMAICEMVFRTSKTGCTPVAVSHPTLALADINAVVVEEIEWPEKQDDLSWHGALSCIQYAPPVKLNVSRPLQGDVLNGVSDAFSGAKGAAPASSSSPQLPQPPSATKPKP